MLIARSILRAGPTRIVQPAFLKPVLVSSTSQPLRCKSDRPHGATPGGPDQKSRQQDLQYYPSKRLQRQQAKQDAAAEKTGELDGGAIPSRNTTSTSQPDPAIEDGAIKSSTEGREFNKMQEEFNSPQSPGANTAPMEQPAQAGTDASEPAPRRPMKPLPDLRQGIPSTFAEEFFNKKAATTPDNPDTIEDQHNPNITEDPRLDDTEGPADGAGRDQGELPKSAYQTSIDRRRDAMARWFYLAFGLLLTTGGVYLGRNWDTEEEERAHPDAPSGWDFGLFWGRIKARINNQRSYYTEPTFPKLLPDIEPKPPYTLVLSLEDMLIHSEWSREHGWRTAKRPGLDYFLAYLSQYYELVLFTTMPNAFGDPIVRKLDPYHFMPMCLYREATRYENGQYIKDLSYLNRPLDKTIIIDTKAEHVKAQPENAIVLKPWKGEKGDKELVELIPYLEHIAAIGVPDVRQSLKAFEGKHIPTEFARRLEKSRAEFNKQLEAEKAKRGKRSAGGMISGMLGIRPQGGMTYDGTTRVADELAAGKMLADQIRENGIKQYQIIEQQIKENGAKWIAEEEEMTKKLMQEQMQTWKKGWFGLGGGGGDSEQPPKAA